MSQEVVVHYTEAIVRQAANYFFARFLRRNVVNVVVGVGLPMLGLGAWLLSVLDWPFAAALGGLGIMLVGMVVFAGFAYGRAAVARFREMRDPTVLWRFEEEFFATKSELGSGELKWRAVSEIWRFPGVWLFFFGKNNYGYSSLPTAELSPELQEYILDRVQANGGKIT